MECESTATLGRVSGAYTRAAGHGSIRLQVNLDRSEAGDGEQRAGTARSTRSLRARGYHRARAFIIRVDQCASVVKNGSRCLAGEEIAA